MTIAEQWNQIKTNKITIILLLLLLSSYNTPQWRLSDWMKDRHIVFHCNLMNSQFEIYATSYYTVSRKSSPFYLCDYAVKSWLICIIFSSILAEKNLQSSDVHFLNIHFVYEYYWIENGIDFVCFQCKKSRATQQ